MKGGGAKRRPAETSSVVTAARMGTSAGQAKEEKEKSTGRLLKNGSDKKASGKKVFTRRVTKNKAAPVTGKGSGKGERSEVRKKNRLAGKNERSGPYRTKSPGKESGRLTGGSKMDRNC